MRLPTRVFLQVAALAMMWASSTAFINPAFTPVDLVKQSDTIATVEVKVDEKGMATVTLVKTMKGKLAGKDFKLDLQPGPHVDAEGKVIMASIKSGDKDGIVFVGRFPAGLGQAEGEGGPVGGAPAEKAKGYLHIGGKWLVIEAMKGEEEWDLEAKSDIMMGTWSGATDMLVRVVNYVLTDPSPNLPVKETIDWDQEVQFGKLDGKINRAMPVNVAGPGKSDLFIAVEKGDHLYRWNGKTMEDITATAAITTKSVAFSWGDFNGDGKLDLASWDGKELSILSQGDKGVFTAKVASTGGVLKDCMSLTTLDLGSERKGRPALLASTKASPVIVTIEADGSAKAKELVSGDFPGKMFGEGAECLVADFNNDGMPDIIQMFAQGGMFYKGTKPGEFAAPVKLGVGFGKGAHGVCIGDWDADGLLDIFTCSEEQNFLWHNMGVAEGKVDSMFLNTIGLSGSVSYISKAGAVFAQTADFNNDGRQGLFMLYGTPMLPQLYFNRGFRSFGLSRKLEGQTKAVPAANAGQQAGCLGDFTGIGAPSLVLVPTNGELWIFPRKVETPPLGVTVGLSIASPNAGPVTVWATTGKRQMGAAVVRAGEPGMFYGAEEAGPVTVKWRFPGGEMQQKEVIVEAGTVRLMIDKAAGSKAADGK